jgi:DNA-binding protein Fis
MTKVSHEDDHHTAGSGTSPPAHDITKVYKQIEGKLESVVEKLLISKLNETDNVLDHMHAVIERVFIISAMKMTINNVSQASKLLGMNRNTLTRKIKELGIKT